MTHLRIEQNNGVIEEVSASIISKLYELAISGTLDNTSQFKGRLHVDVTYPDYIDYLTDRTKYLTEDLYITASDTYIRFADPEVLNVLNANSIGSNGNITLSLADAVVSFPNELFKDNTTITTFNELSKFINLHVISQSCFRGCTNLTSISLNSITQIKGEAFEGCTSLESIDLTGVTLTGDHIFDGCTALTEVDIDFSNIPVANLGNMSSFVKGCTSLQTFDCTGLLVLASNFFLNCTGLTTVTGLSNITSIQNDCFNGCTSLTTTNIDWTNLTSIKSSAFKNCKELQISLNCNSLTTLGAWVFLNCEELSLVSSLGSMTYISESCFEGCKGLTSVNLPSSVTAFYDYCFKNCTNLSTINLPSSITTIGKESFKNSKISNTIDLPNLTSLRSTAFGGCTNITSVTDLGSITKIEKDTFSGCTNLTSITIPSTCTGFGARAFLGCSSLVEINAPNVNLTVGLTSDFNSLFSNCTSLQKVTLGDCYELGNSWSSHEGGRIHFYNCSSLTTVDVKSLSRVAGNTGYTAFRNCPNMSTFILRSTTIPVNTLDPTMTMSPFGGNNVTLYVPDSALNDYKTAWPDIANKIKGISELPSS